MIHLLLNTLTLDWAQEWLWKKFSVVLVWFQTVCGVIKTFLVTLFSHLFSQWLTETTIYIISEGLALILTTSLFLMLLSFVWKGIGTLVSKVVEIVFLKGGDGIMYLAKQVVYRIFSSIAWIFNGIANGIKKILFG